MTSAEAQAMITEAQATREEAKKVRRYIVTAGLAVLVPLIVLLATVVLGTVVLVRLQDIAETNQHNGEVVRDCTTPGGECFERGAKATGDAVNTINRVTILVAECVHDEVPDVRSCVSDRLTP